LICIGILDISNGRLCLFICWIDQCFRGADYY